jgi:hypothetical protein
MGEVPKVPKMPVVPEVERIAVKALGIQAEPSQDQKHSEV